MGSFAFGIVVLALFVRHELRTAEPMLQLRWFTNGRFSAASVSIMLLFFALTGFIFGVTQYLQAVKGYSALAAGIRTLPFAVAVMVWAPLSAKLAERFGTKLMVSGGLSVFGIGLLVAATMTTTSGYGLVVVSMVLMGSGMGLAMAPATDSVMGALPAEEAGVGSAVNDTTRELGATLGVAVGGSAIASVYSPKIAAALAGQPIPPSAAAIAKHSIEGALAVAQQAGPRADALVPLARHAFTQGLRLDSLIAAGVVFLGAAVAARWLPARAGQDAPVAEPVVADLTVDAVDHGVDDGPVAEPAPSLVGS
jgi:MFS family permease